jgi:hypothetical protein
MKTLVCTTRGTLNLKKTSLRGAGRRGQPTGGSSLMPIKNK